MSCPIASAFVSIRPFTEEACNALPDMSLYLAQYFGFENIEVTTDDGYILQMAHITTDELGNESVNAPLKGPLLMIHDQDTDGTSYLEKYDFFERDLVGQYFNDGWDIYMANMRGTKPSRLHTTFDPDGTGANGAADYWNFDLST